MNMRFVGIRSKFLFITLAVVTAAVLLSGVSVYRYTYQIMSRNLIQNEQTLMANIDRNLSYMIDNIEDYASVIAFNEQIQKHLSTFNVRTQDFQYHADAEKLEEQLREYFLLRDNTILDIYLVDNEYNDVLTRRWTMKQEDRQSFVRHLADNKDQLSGFTGAYRLYDRFGSPAEVFSYYVKVNNLQSNKQIGLLIIDLKNEVIVDSIRDIDSNVNNYFLLDADNRPIVSSIDVGSYLASVASAKNEAGAIIDRNNQVIILRTIEETGWTLGSVISRDKLDEQLQTVTYVIVLILCLCLIIMFGVVVYMVNRLTKPLLKLIRGMNDVSIGRWSTEIHIDSNDEIRLAANVFNHMVVEIKRKMGEIVERERKEKELQLQVLIGQLNPHFIYNTLNCVIYLARKAGANDIIALTKSFIEILQYGIVQKFNDFVAVRDEIAYLRHYFEVLSYRYTNMIELRIDLDEDAADAAIPRMLLYPIVENSVFHGLLSKDGDGWVEISVKRAGNRIAVAIADNGIGMPERRLTELQSEIAKEEHETAKHIGLRNVYQRMRHIYGNEAFMTISSKPGEGTVVALSYPDLKKQ